MKAKERLLASLKIWLVIFPSIILFHFLFGKQLSPLPLYQRTFILTISLVPWMMFIGVPLLDFLINHRHAFANTIFKQFKKKQHERQKSI